MGVKNTVLLCCLFFFSTYIFGQQVTYSEPDRSDVRQTNFEIIGKIGENILIYKNLRDSHAMSVLRYGHEAN